MSYILTKSSGDEDYEGYPNPEEDLGPEMEEIRNEMDTVSSSYFVINISVTNLYAAVFWLKGI